MTAKVQWVRRIERQYGLPPIQIGVVLEAAGLIDENGKVWDPSNIYLYNKAIVDHVNGERKREELLDKAMNTPKPEECPFCHKGEKKWNRNYNWTCSEGGLSCYLGYTLYYKMERLYGDETAKEVLETYRLRREEAQALTKASEAEIWNRFVDGGSLSDSETDQRTANEIYWTGVLEPLSPHSRDTWDEDPGGMGQETFPTSFRSSSERSETMGNVAEPVAKRSETFRERIEAFLKRR